MNQIQIINGAEPYQRVEIAKLYFSVFERKLNTVLGKRRALTVIRQSINLDRVILAVNNKKAIGFAGLSYDEKAFFAPDKIIFQQHYGAIMGNIRNRLDTIVRTKPRSNQVLLEGLGVLPEARGQGVGTKLLKAVDNLASEFGKTEVILEVVDTNPKAKALYERYGYDTVHTTHSWLFRPAGFSASELMLHILD